MLSACAAALLAACGGAGGGGDVQLGGQSIAQVAVNCEDAPVDAPYMGLTFADSVDFPNAEQRTEFAGGFDQGVPYAAYAPASGNGFYGFPIEGALNDAWIVTAPVDEVAATVLRERGLDTSLDQIRGGGVGPATPIEGSTYVYVPPPGFKSAMFYGEASDAYGEYDAALANQASGGRYDFTAATQAYTFPESTSARTGFIQELTLWRLSDTQTLARCYVRDPTVG